MVVSTSAAFDCRPNHDEASMSTSTTGSATAASNTVSLGASVSGGKTTVTTERTIILAQIRGLQKQLGEVTKQLQTLAGKSDPASIQESIELEHEIEGIQEEIRALQNELLQKSADQKVQVSAGKDGSADAAAAPSSSSSSSSSSAGSGDSGGGAPAASTATVGSVIDIQA